MTYFFFILVFFCLTVVNSAPLLAQAKGGASLYSQKKSSAKSLVLCPDKIFWSEANTIHFSSLEKKLICGDPKVPAWSEVPFNQARYHLTNFLQARGYHQLDFNIQDNKLTVTLGPATLARQLTVQGKPVDLKMSRKRKVIKHPLTPALLNEVEQWALGNLRSQAYPCPDLATHADLASGEIIVQMQPGPRQRVLSVTEEQVLGLAPGAFRKYDAFQLEKDFNADLLELTSTRNKNTGVLQSSYFTWSCEAEGADLYQRTFAGKPRLFTLGFGASTDEWGIFRSSWRNARWGQNASSFLVSLDASYFRQDLEVQAQWYAFSPLSRWFLQPQVSVSHEREDDFHFLSFDGKFAIGRSYDNQKFGLNFNAGPNLNFTRTFSGAESGFTRFLSLQYVADLKSHDWEIYQNDPRSGYHIALSGDFSAQSILSSMSAQAFQLEGQYLYNLRRYDPHLLVIGVRGGLYGTYAASDTATRDLLPPNYRYYIGGSQNLRGFSRKELPEGEGALSAAWASVEVRLANQLPFWIEPFVFLDAGLLGDQAFQFKAPVYFSPGLGVRVASPVGVFRGSASHGFLAGNNGADLQDLSHWQFHLSYGEEF